MTRRLRAPLLDTGMSYRTGLPSLEVAAMAAVLRRIMRRADTGRREEAREERGAAAAERVVADILFW
jgi:hypothetical protein